MNKLKVERPPLENWLHEAYQISEGLPEYKVPISRFVTLIRYARQAEMEVERLTGIQDRRIEQHIHGG